MDVSPFHQFSGAHTTHVATHFDVSDLLNWIEC